MAEVFMIENTKDQTFWTNLGWKKDHGTLYRSTITAQNQIDKGKLSMFFIYNPQVSRKDVKVSKFNITRIEE